MAAKKVSVIAFLFLYSFISSSFTILADEKSKDDGNVTYIHGHLGCYLTYHEPPSQILNTYPLQLQHNRTKMFSGLTHEKHILVKGLELWSKHPMMGILKSESY